MDIKTSKMAISKDSDLAVDRMLIKINAGFTGGRVTKVDLASWIILHFEAHALEHNLEKIRKDHFDQVTYLESVIKDMKLARKSGTAQKDLSTLLGPVSESLRSSKKRTQASNPS